MTDPNSDSISQDEPLNEVEMQEELKKLARVRLLFWSKRLFLSGTAFILSCGSIYPFLADHALHAHWESFGKYLLLLPMPLLLLLVYCGFSTWSAWTHLQGVQTNRELLQGGEERTVRTWLWPKLLLISIFGFIAIYMSYKGILDLMIAGRQRTVVATITAHDVHSKHPRDQYAFSLDGKSYAGWLYPHGATFETGSKVFVHYDPTNPARNSLNDFSTEGLESSGIAFLMLCGLGVVAKARFGRWYERSAST